MELQVEFPEQHQLGQFIGTYQLDFNTR
jgi:hypothetical protein